MAIKFLNTNVQLLSRNASVVLKAEFAWRLQSYDLWPWDVLINACAATDGIFTAANFSTS
jgi:hypothetical protein